MGDQTIEVVFAIKIEAVGKLIRGDFLHLDD